MYRWRYSSVADNRLYNSRVTTETLEKKFRDTFPSQPGAELVDDLYASGVIVPVVDFTAAAEGSELRADLQTATDYATDFNALSTSATVTLINTPGFWNVDIQAVITTSTTNSSVILEIDDGTTAKKIFQLLGIGAGSTDGEIILEQDKVIFLRSGDSLIARTGSSSCRANFAYRQIADVSGNLVNPLGFTSS